MQNSPIAVLGAGSWGTALALLLARNQQEVHLWGYDSDEVQALINDGCNQHYLPGCMFPDNLHASNDLAAVLQTCQDVLIVVPSHGFRSTLEALKPHVNQQLRLAWATKGIDPEKNILLHQVIEEVLGDHIPHAIVSGPSFAKEVAVGLPTAVAVAGNDDKFVADLTQRLSNTHFRIYTNKDIIGVEVGGSVKNVMAIATGVADGLGFGANARSALITRGLAEMMRLGAAIGAQKATFMGLAGVGDLVLTCTDDQSRNRRFGLALGKGESLEQAEKDIGQVVEGINTAVQLHQMAEKYNVEMPITEQVYMMTQGHITAKQAFENLLSRELKPE